MARINRSAHSPCARLYSCDPIITDRYETITSPRRVGRAARRRMQYFTSARATLTPG